MLPSSNTAYDKKALGASGENLVADFLRTKGFKVLEQNYSKRFGEIDVIARKDDVLAFVEVKLRKNAYFPISQVITYPKQKKIIKTAQAFIFENKLYTMVYRFDVAIVTFDDWSKPDIMYIENAFTKSTD
jgi:putative endonuclease